ncbi:TPA: multidrug ABC transporter ATPase [Salmonella enterica]|nr:multidrug ABC transporter ATPase [Salmonella enterica]
MAATLPLVTINYSVGNPAERLKRALSENKGRYTVSKNGYISLNLNNADVQEAIEKQIHNLTGIKESK